jgi:hypothetical protein
MIAHNFPRKVVIVRKKPCRPPLAQTQIDHEHCIERRRWNAALYDKMSQVLNALFGGKATMRNLMDLAVKIVAQKQIKIDHGAKRMKEELICWFCENASHLVAKEAAPCPEFERMESSLEAWASPESDGFDLPLQSLPGSDDLLCMLDSLDA